MFQLTSRFRLWSLINEDFHSIMIIIVVAACRRLSSLEKSFFPFSG